MGRKRNKGKARRAAKAKAREEAATQTGSGHNNDRAATLPEQSLAAQMRQLQLQLRDKECKHGLFDPDSTNNIHIQFINAFNSSLIDALRSDCSPVSGCLVHARSATLDEFSNVWKDSAKLEIVTSCCICLGAEATLEGRGYIVRLFATVARFFEQYIAVELRQSQALPKWPKVEDTYHADDHTLVKFFWKRIPCSCLDEKYNEVKSITKLSICYYPECSTGVKVERSKAKYCSRCRCAAYCSRECQKADWSFHKSACDNFAAMIAEFEAKRHE